MNLHKPSGLRSIIVSSLLLAFVAVLLGMTIVLVRVKLLQNTQDLGIALAHSYAAEEENSLHTLENSLVMASHYVNEMVAGGGSVQDIQGWLAGYFAKLTHIIGEDAVDFYAVIDGQIVAPNPWNGDDGYDYRAAVWYRPALEADGQPVCSEAYQDAISGQRIVTLSLALEGEGNVLAMDVYIQNPALHRAVEDIPETFSYYLCDRNGLLLYSTSYWSGSPDEQQAHADFLLAGVADGSLLAYDATFEDPDGVARGAYNSRMANGWTVVITAPLHAILMGEGNTTISLMAVVALVVYLTLVFLTVQDMLRRRRMKMADDTARMLGDSFYAIYRVNFREGRYQTLKAYQSVSFLPASGSYDLLLKTIGDVVQPTTFHAFESGFSLESIRQRAGRQVADYGGDYQRRFGDVYRWVNIRTLYDPKADPDVVILCFRDVDEEKRRELQQTLLLQDALDVAQKSTKAKSRFFNSMSHDMRTPLNAIMGYCELAQKSCAAGDTDKTGEYLTKIAFASDQLLGLINDILEISRMEAGKSNLEQRELNLRELLDRLADMFRDRAREEGKTLEVSIDFQDDRVMGDERKIGQIVNNLLSNAVKYTEPGDHIRLEARQFSFHQHSKYQLVVEDTGIGMTQGFLEHLFDPYSRETAFTSRPVTGTGLGMSIVKSLVQQMSGEISVDSELGRGSRFTVTIPFKTVEGRDPAGDVRQTPPDPTPPFAWNGRRILVAEDNELNREILTALLEQLGIQVLSAADGQEAVHAFLSQPPFSVDAILMDMQMPRMDGCQAAAAIRRLERPDAGVVPIVAVTANAFAEDIDRTTAAGMNAHVSKPIDSAVLCRTMEKLIREREEAGPKSPTPQGRC